MGVDGADGEHQPVGDLGVGQAVGQQCEDVNLALGQPGRIGPRADVAAAREPLHPELAQPAPDHAHGGGRAEVLESA